MRHLVILENPGYTPAQRGELLKMLRALLPVLNVRIATSHVEVDVYGEPESAKLVLEKFFGRTLDVVDITFENVESGVDRYVQLFNQERFWEAHNALETLWRSSRSPTLQGLILLAAAYVKLQEGNLDKFETLLREAVELIREDVGCVKSIEIKTAAARALLEKKPFKICL